MDVLTNTRIARHEREAGHHEGRRRLPAIQRVHLLRCRSGPPALPVAGEDVSGMGARRLAFGVTSALGVGWNGMKWKHRRKLMLRTAYSVQRTAYSVQRTAYSVQAFDAVAQDGVA
jgi:hypothetical protein